ncbi:MAG: hypothetical protein Q9227_005075 [Pyrenula ochraceoflavens]
MASEATKNNQKPTGVYTRHIDHIIRPHTYQIHLLEVSENSVGFRPGLVSTKTLTFENIRPEERVRILCNHCLQCEENDSIEKRHRSCDTMYTTEEQKIIQGSLRRKGFPFTRLSFDFSRGFGHFAKRVNYKENDEPQSISITYVRSMRQDLFQNRGSTWRIHTRYDLTRNIITGIWDNLLPDNQEELKQALIDLAALQGHPLHLFCAALEVQVGLSFKGAKSIHEVFLRHEVEVGITRSKGWNNVLAQEDFKRHVGACEKKQSQLIFLQKQQKLLMHFLEFLNSLNDELEKIGCIETLPKETRQQLQGMKHRVAGECLSNIRCELQSVDDNIDCSLQRIKASSALLNNIMSYQTTTDSNRMASSNNQMAEVSNRMAIASTGNSKIGTAIAFGTFTFLPATAVATFFSMSTFDFSSGAERTVSPKFWIFWAVEVPLNLVLLLALIAWIGWQRNKSPRERTEEDMQEERQVMIASKEVV